MTWERFKQFTESNIMENSDHGIMGLSYWRNKLFTNIIVYLLPVSLVALVPGVIMSIKGGIPLLAVYDTLAAFAFAFIAFKRGLSLSLRKTLLTIFLYLLSIILLFYLGSFGPGLLYLLALTVFITLIFPVSIAWLSIAINTIICILFIFIIHFKLLDSPLANIYTLGSWIAVSSNLIFLSIVSVASLNLLFKGMQATIIKEGNLQKELVQKSKTLENMLESMERKNQELEQFAYIASHDLQEPLRTITGIADQFEKQYKEKLDEDAVMYLTYLSQSTTRMRLLIKGLLDYSRIGKERELEFVNCNTILKELTDELDMLIKENKAIIFIDDLPSLNAYKIEFRQLFQNLISNAIKFRKTETSPEIKISAKEENEYWIFSVKDNGIGIEEKFHEKIFVIFQRLHSKSQYEGTGIGLAHCKKIVELHGGKIWVDSKPEQGSTFYFTIPKK
jgi:signal transduction histidine kinase